MILSLIHFVAKIIPDHTCRLNSQKETQPIKKGIYRIAYKGGFQGVDVNGT